MQEGGTLKRGLREVGSGARQGEQGPQPKWRGRYQLPKGAALHTLDSNWADVSTNCKHTPLLSAAGKDGGSTQDVKRKLPPRGRMLTLTVARLLLRGLEGRKEDTSLIRLWDAGDPPTCPLALFLTPSSIHLGV